jgi:nitrogen fixation protein FixH
MVVVGLLSFSLLTQGVLLTLALDGSPGLRVEKDYYARGLAWDEHMERVRHDAALGWRVALESQRASQSERRLRLRLEDAAGRPLRGAQVTVSAFHGARPDREARALLREDGDGYRGLIPLTRPGLWRVRVEVRQGGEQFNASLTHEVPHEAPTQASEERS